MKTKTTPIIACYLLAVIASYSQTNTFSVKEESIDTVAIRGNSGTDTAVNFMGTKDAQP